MILEHPTHNLITLPCRICGRLVLTEIFLFPGNANVVGVFCDGRVDCPDFSDECNANCWLSNYFCDSVTEIQENAFGLRCADANGAHNLSDDFVGFVDVCDGLANCVGTSNDEAECLASTHFYCPGQWFLNFLTRQRVFVPPPKSTRSLVGPGTIIFALGSKYRYQLY